MFYIEELSIEELDKKIASLNNDIMSFDDELNTSYSLEMLSSMQEQEIKQILGKYGLESRFNDLYEYFSVLFLYQNENIYSQFSKTLNPIKEKANNVVLEINNIIRRRIEIIKNHNELIENQISFCNTLKKYLQGEFKYTKEAYDNLITSIIQSDITPENKIKLSLMLSKKLIEIKQSKAEKTPVVIEEGPYTPSIIDSFEESLIVNEEKASYTEQEKEVSQFRREQIEFANAQYDKYKDFISSSIFSDPKEVYGILNFEYISQNGYLLDDFALYLVISVSSIKDLSLSDEEIQEYAKILRNLDEMFIKTKINYENSERERIRIEKEQKIINDINSKISDNNSKLQDLFSSSNALETIPEQDFFDTLMHLQHRLETVRKASENIKIGSLGNFEQIQLELNFIKEKIDELNEKINERKQSLAPVEIKTFALFDTDDQSKKTFLYEDLLGDNPFIDMNAIIGNNVSEEDKNYQQNISKLIGDIMLFGECEYMHSINTSSSNYGDKIEGIIYRTDDKGNVLREEKTPLWRIRPTPRSNVRFIERKIVIPQNSELFNQVKAIIQKRLPKVIIPSGESFTLMVNLGCAIKMSDTEIYTTAYRRFKDRDVKPLSLFYENGNYGKQGQKATKLKTKLSDEECKAFDAFVVTSLQSLYEMSKEDPLYDFSFIDGMGGEKEYGLQ